MARRKKDVMRILAWDISLSSPGAAVIDVDTAKNKAYVVAHSHCKTAQGEALANRTQHIEAWAQLFARQYPPYDAVVREGYNASMAHQNYTVFSAWSAVDRGLLAASSAVTEKPIAQSSVKKLVVGKGRAEKAEVAQAVRDVTGYAGQFATDDESDACAIGLALAIKNEWLTVPGRP